MAPGYRNSTRRQNRSGLADHDIYEGLPIRQWRRGMVTVEPSSIQEHTIQQNNIWAVELPHGMPRDSHLLPKHSQDLLRAARSGRTYRRPVSTEEEEVEIEAIIGDKAEKKDEPLQDHGFVAKAWKQVPRHLEGPDIEFLAKRRKGLVTATESLAFSTGPQIVKTIVKKVDAVGNEYVQEIFISSRKQNERESIPIIPDPSSIIDGGMTQNQSFLSKRKGPFRKKIKPVGRGRKKKLLPPTSAPNESVIGSVQNIKENDGMTYETYVSSMQANNEDMEMGEESVGNSEEGEGDDGEENEEDDELVDNQSLPSTSKAMLDTKLEDLTTETNTRYASLIEPEKVAATNRLKSNNTDKFILGSSSGLQLANTVPRAIESTIKSEIIVGTSVKVNAIKSQEVLQTPDETLSLVSNTPLLVDIKPKDDALLRNETLDSETRTNYAERSEEKGESADHSGSQMVQRNPEPSSDPLVYSISDSSFTQHEYTSAPLAGAKDHPTDLERRENQNNIRQI